MLSLMLGAIAQGRACFDGRGIGWKPPLIAAVLCGTILFWFHRAEILQRA